jgi:predicted NBD/HSP70 family sugar kinase
VVNLFNPEIVVIGGGPSRNNPAYIKLIDKYTRKFAFKSATSKLALKKAYFANDSGWIGAACLNF